MAKAHSKLKSTTCKVPTPLPTERFYTIAYVPQGLKPHPSPQLTIKERRLEQIGFYAGKPVTIEAKPGLLVIKLVMSV